MFKLRFPSEPVHPRKSQHQFRHPGLLCLAFDPSCSVLRKIPAEHPSYVEKRAAPTHKAYVMGAVTDHLTFSAQHGILQRNRIEKSSTFRLRALHHRTSRDV
jgi:hypothetical protein